MNQAQKVKEYYNQWTDRYLEIYGNVIQAFRTKNVNDLLDYIIESSGLRWGMHVLDAGCGVGGPAIYFSQKLNLRIDGITISNKQVEIAGENIAKLKLSKKVNIQEGDYHYLSSLFPDTKFSAVLFLESLGHAERPDQVIFEASKRIKKNGFIYVKDFFRKIPEDKTLQAKIDKVIGNMNKHYEYKTLDLEPTIEAFRKAGLEVDFIKKFAFNDDISVRQQFETASNIDVFEDMEEFAPAEWLELKFSLR